MPAMVSITNTSVQEVQDWFRGGSMQYESKSAGSGVIMGENDSELLIVSNNHVVEGATNIAVTFINETSVEGIVKGTDEDNDLAVVAVSLDDIDDDTMSQIRIASAADSDEVRVGEQVVAIGNALGYGQSVTTGIVSALGREVTVRNTYGYSDYEELIQTDAAINAGNSGGALLNMNGEVIGINSIKASANGVEGMGYAIPTAKALPIIQRLMNRETSEKVSEDDIPYIGITGENVDESVSQLYGLPVGIYLSEVSEDSPADEAGLRKGMIMTAFDGEKIKTMADLQKMLEYYAAGETVTVTVQKADENGEIQEQEISLTLGRRADYIRMN
jgi:serine protease Do